ncbi:hypothetical protein GS506_16790 [Rhodococcus hoagii]|nr:hypothetical protein [Prescottella equi]
MGPFLPCPQVDVRAGRTPSVLPTGRRHDAAGSHAQDARRERLVCSLSGENRPPEAGNGAESADG